MKRVYWRLLPFLLFALLAAFLWRGLSLEPSVLPSVQVGKSLPGFHLQTLGNTAAPFTPQTLRGKMCLLNVWASWCAACTEEQGFLMQLSRQGIPIYGLNYKDHAADATSWLTVWGNPYQAIGSDVEGRVAMELGVYGAPETFLIDKKGIIQYRYAGILTPDVWQHTFLPMIHQWEQANV